MRRLIDIDIESWLARARPEGGAESMSSDAKRKC
jgi:hypothetical protein